jgi:autotransporter-associated beta strand protein
LQLGNGSTTGSIATTSTVSVGTGAVFAVNRSNPVTQGTDFSASPITGAGGFAQTGTGVTTLSAVGNSYSGGTTVTNGGLRVTGSLTGAGAVTVGGGSTLGTAAVLSGGNGTTTGGGITGDTTIGTDATHLGILAPGVGTVVNQALSFTGNLTVTAGSQIDLRITHATANLATVNSTDFTTLQSVLGSGNYNASTNNVLNILGTNLIADSAALNSVQSLTNHDLVNVGGTLTVTSGASTPAFQLVDNGYSSGSIAVGDMFKLVDWSSLSVVGTGTLTAADFTLPALASGFSFDTSAFQTYGVIVVVPEPSRILLLIVGLLGLFYSRRRRYSRL